MSSPTSRLLHLLSLLQVRRDWPGSVLADRLDVAPRTVRRDVERLREMGYRIRAVPGPDGGYRLDAGSELPPMLFDDDQAVALALSLHAATALGNDVSQSALRALATVRQVMPAHLRHRIDAVSVASLNSALGDSAPRVDMDSLLAISTATRDHHYVRFDYGADADTTDQGPRLAEPHHVVTSNGRWYLLAWDMDRAGWRTFRVDRMRLRMPTGKRFTPREFPEGDPTRFVAALFKGSSHDDAWPCQGRVTLARPAREIAPFAGDAVVTEVDDRHCMITIGSWSWNALAARLGQFDAEIAEVSPAELAQAFDALAHRFHTAATSHPA